MKIQNDNTTSVLDSLARSNQAKSSKDSVADGKVGGSGSDKVELSSRTEEVQKLTAKAMAAPDVRQDKVDRITESLANQTYNVKGEMVARSILKSQLLDQVL